MIKKVSPKVIKTSKKVIQKEMKAGTSCHEPYILTNLSGFPSHSKDKRRLSRIRGQIDGIDRMIDDGRYCLDIIFQIRAAASALKALEKEVMHTHIKSCVKKAIDSDDHYEANEKIQEIMDFF
jgi:DNA-binding FrmR family transcriptional regulator